jgi:hypothetical protein
MSSVIVQGNASGTGAVTVESPNTDSTYTVNLPTIASSLGYLNTPVNSKSADYTAVLADSGKTILHAIADDNPRTFTIPANSSVAYDVGTVLTFVNLINTSNDCYYDRHNVSRQ